MKSEGRQVGFVGEASVCFLDLSLCLLKLGLTQFYDGAKPELISGLRQIESSVRFVEQLSGYTHSLLRGHGAEPSSPYVADDAIGQLPALLIGRLCPEVCLRCLGMKLESIEDGNTQVEARGSIPILSEVGGRAARRNSDYSKGSDRGQQLFVLCVAESHIRIVIQPEGLQVGPLFHGKRDNFVHRVGDRRRYDGVIDQMIAMV